MVLRTRDTRIQPHVCIVELPRAWRSQGHASPGLQDARQERSRLHDDSDLERSAEGGASHSPTFTHSYAFPVAIPLRLRDLRDKISMWEPQRVKNLEYRASVPVWMAGLGFSPDRPLPVAVASHRSICLVLWEGASTRSAGRPFLW